MQFHALLALTLAASASARLSQRTTLESRALDECARECTTDYLVSDAYKQADCDSKKVRPPSPILPFHPLTPP